mgnify:CR=1 FL=1
MPADEPTILATSGGMRMNEEGRRRLDFAPLVHHAVELSGVHGRAPRVCMLGTASGDQRWFAAELDEAGRGAGFELTHLHLFGMPSIADVTGHLLAQDVVWVGGGSVANLLAVTGGVITSAGVVLAATFAALGVLPLIFLVQLAFIVAFGVLLDTLIVRSLLVPALSHDIGRAIWWPSKLARSDS